MSFVKSKCVIRKIYCGEKPIPHDTATVKYSRAGSSYECMKRGYGAALANTRQLTTKDVRNIKYIGDAYAKNLKRKRITSLNTLVSKTKNMTAAEKKALFMSCCKKSNGIVDHRAVNSLIMYLYEKGVDQLPACKIVME